MIYLGKTQKHTDPEVGKTLQFGPYRYVIREGTIPSEPYRTYFLGNLDGRNDAVFMYLGVTNKYAYLESMGIKAERQGVFPYLSGENLLKCILLLTSECQKKLLNTTSI